MASGRVSVPWEGNRQPIPMASRVGNILFTSFITAVHPVTGETPKP